MHPACIANDRAAADELFRKGIGLKVDTHQRFADDIAASREDFPAQLQDQTDEIIATGTQAAEAFRGILEAEAGSAAQEEALAKAIEAQRAFDAAKGRLKTSLGLDPGAEQPGSPAQPPEGC